MDDEPTIKLTRRGDSLLKPRASMRVRHLHALCELFPGYHARLLEGEMGSGVRQIRRGRR